MKKIVAVLLILQVMVSCHNHGKRDVSQVSPADTIDIFSHIFKSKTLQDSLNTFLNGTEGFLICDTLVYSVYMYKSYPLIIREGHPITYKENPDTILVFNLSNEIWFDYDPCKPEETTFLGAAINGNKVIGVSCTGMYDCYNIFHENNYNQDIWYRHYKTELTRNDCPVNVFWPCSDVYKLVDMDSLVLLRRNRYKRDFSRYSKKIIH